MSSERNSNPANHTRGSTVVRTLGVGGSEATLGAPQRGAGGRCRWQVVQVWTVAGPDLRGGFPPGPGRGIQAFSRESPDAKSRGGMPPRPPIFYGPLVSTRSFWRLWHIVPVVGLLRGPCTCPDLERFFV